MAKGQMRSNRETKKPKAKKPAAAEAGVTPALKGTLVPTVIPKKKG